MYVPLPVTSEQVANFQGMIETSARKFAKLEVPLAEYDDLVQVGMIHVWTRLRRGIIPASWSVDDAMKNELTRVGRFNGDHSPTVIDFHMDDLDAEFLALDGADL